MKGRNFGIAIIPTADEDGTVSVIAAIARREQQAGGGAPHAHGKKTHRTLKEQQQHLVSSIPGVGNAVAKNLLRHFGSVERVFASDGGGAEGGGAGGAEDRREDPGAGGREGRCVNLGLFTDRKQLVCNL